MKDGILKIVERLFKPRVLYTFLFFGATTILMVQQLPIPELLKTIDIALLAFYFGEKSAKYVLNGNDHKIEKIESIKGCYMRESAKEVNKKSQEVKNGQIN